MSLWQVIADYVLDAKFGFQSANAIKGNIIALASARSISYAGGSRIASPAPFSGAGDLVDYLDIELDGTQLSGLTVQARVEVRTTNAGTSVTPKVRNVTTATDMATGAACTATTADFSGTNSKQSLAFTPTTGINKYRIQLVTNNAMNPVIGIGYVEIFATS